MHVALSFDRTRMQRHMRGGERRCALILETAPQHDLLKMRRELLRIVMISKNQPLPAFQSLEERPKLSTCTHRQVAEKINAVAILNALIVCREIMHSCMSLSEPNGRRSSPPERRNRRMFS